MVDEPIIFANYRNRAAEQAERKAKLGEASVGGGGGGPYDPGVETRIASLETAMKQVNASLNVLELSSTRIEAVLNTLATKADVVLGQGETQLVAAGVKGLTDRIALLETGLSGIGSKVDSKLVSGGQMFAIFGGLMTLFVVFGGILVGVLRYTGLLSH